jgi:3-isopropylmalate/(R)-2-methylmalate dehydratase small subunit
MAVDLGLQTVTCPEAAAAAKDGDVAYVDTTTGDVRIGSRLFKSEPLPAFIREIVDQGGMAPYVKAKLQRSKGTGA